MTIGERIKNYRHLRNLTQQELGEKIGVHKATINKYETGIIENIGILTLQKIADALDVDVDQLVLGNKTYKTVHTSNVSERLKEALSKKNMKLTELAERTGTYKGTISHYIAGSYEPKHNTLIKLANALDVTVSWLSGYETKECDPNECEIWDNYTKLSPKQRQFILIMMKELHKI